MARFFSIMGRIGAGLIAAGAIRVTGSQLYDAIAASPDLPTD